MRAPCADARTRGGPRCCPCDGFEPRVTFLTYFHTIRHEEKNLKTRFGAPYVAYCREVGPLWPKPKGLKKLFASFVSKNKAGSFSMKQYMKNKEWECLLGVLAVFLILFFGQPR